MSDRVGMDPDRVEQAATRVRASVSSLQTVAGDVDRLAWASLNPLTYGIQPGGLIIAPGAIAGTVWSAATVRSAAEAAQELAAVLMSQALDQRLASAGGEMSRGVSRRAHHRFPAGVDANDPDAVAAWWSSLAPAERAQYISGSPSTVANLDGVPFADRISAHQVWAEERLADPTLSGEERAYLERVADGSVQLILYDPQRDRIIEAIGDLSVPASRVVTYVPGTDTNLEGFHKGDTQQVGRYLENKVPGTVVFVYKDGPWADLGWGERGNATPNSDYVRDRGADLAIFQQSTSREPNLSNAATIAISHSWGTTAMAGAEVAGARYDSVISLSGAYLPDQWQAQSGTGYHYLRYDVDALTNVERVGGLSPQNAGGWQPAVFNSGAVPVFETGYVMGNGVDNHSRIARGPEDNEDALRHMEQIMRGL